MLIFPTAKLTFLAVPKTGTTAIEAALRPKSGLSFQSNPFKHMSLSAYESVIEPLLKFDAELDVRAFETVCIIREPLDHLRSWHRYLSRDRVPRQARSTKGLSFADYIEAVLSDAPPPFAQVRRQSHFVHSGERRITTLLRYGDPKIEDFFAHRLGYFTTFPRRNVSPQREIAPLPANLEARLQDKWAADFDLFDGIPQIDLPDWPRPSAFKVRINRFRQAKRVFMG